MNFFKILTAQLVIFFSIFLILELVSIKFFPEYSQNQVYKKNFKEQNNIVRISKSKIQYFDFFKNIKIRSKGDNILINYNENLNSIWLFGDSVTNGYGLKYTDTYYYFLEKILKSNNENFNILAVSEYGNNLENIVNVIENNLDIFKNNDYIVFQFNFNDILPESYFKTKKKLIATKEPGFFRNIISSFDPFRFEYLHRSTFLRVLTHYASIIKRKTTGDCVSRGLDALGQYTYSYGSIAYSDDSKDAWKIFENKILRLKQLTNNKKIKFIVLISPISIQLKNHQKLNFHNYDLNCSTINGRKKILDILKNNKIVFSDPLKLFEETIKIDTDEKNFEPLFFEFDTNHPNAKGSYLMSISLSETILNFN